MISWTLSLTTTTRRARLGSLKAVFFSVEYDCITFEDEIGEVFLTLHEAEACAEVVAKDLDKIISPSKSSWSATMENSWGRYPSGNKWEA